MRTTNITLPNGLVGPDGQIVREITIRQLTGEDEDLLRDKKNLREGGVINKLLKRAIVSIGEIEDKKEIARLFDTEMLSADLTTLLIRLRMFSIGERYSFRWKCSVCEGFTRHSVGLDALEVKEQSDEYRGVKLITKELEDDDGKPMTIEFSQLYASGTNRLEAINQQYASEKGTRELLLQLKRVNGASPHPQLLKSWSWGLRNRVRELMDSTIGGIDIELEMVCNNVNCGNLDVATMPIDLADFFFRTGGTSKHTMVKPYREYGTPQQSSLDNGDGLLRTSGD